MIQHFMNQAIIFGRNCHNIFSLLDLIQNSPHDIINKEFIIDREGESLGSILAKFQKRIIS